MIGGANFDNRVTTAIGSAVLPVKSLTKTSLGVFDDRGSEAVVLGASRWSSSASHISRTLQLCGMRDS